jgi:hypothetical protein
MFMMSFYRIPKGVLEKIDYYRSRFLDFASNVMDRKRNIDRLGGISSANLRLYGARYY